MLRYGRWIAAHARAVVAVWIVALIAAFGITFGYDGGLFAQLQQKEPYVASESNDGNERILDGNGSAQSVMIRLDAESTRQAQTVGPQLHRQLTQLPQVARVSSAFSPQSAKFPQARAAYTSSADPRSTMFLATLRPGLTKDQQEKAAQDVTDTAQRITAGHGEVAVGGAVPLLERITGQVETDLRIGEGIAFPLTLIVMVLVFGGFVAAGLPLFGAIAAIGGGLLSLFGFAHLTDLDATTVNIVTILGLGLSIDYGLLIVSRFREELSRRMQGRRTLTGSEYDEAVAATVQTAGRTVVFSGLTVAISVAGLVLFPASVTRAVGLAGLSVVLVACLAALTLVPACARLAARRLARQRVTPDPETGRFASLAQFVQKHVWVSICAVTALLVFLAAPLLGLRQVSSTAALLPAHDDQRTFLSQVRTDFPALAEPDVTVVAKTSVSRAQAWAQQEAPHRPGVSRVTQVQPLKDGYVSVGLLVRNPGPTHPDAERLVTDLRDHRPPFPTMVTGQQAKLMDYSAAIRSHTPLVVGVIALATLLLLFLMTGSLVLPLKALLFNALSLGASLGVLTWIFQDGHAQWLLGYTSNHALESVVPVILLTFGFGLAMDYEVFLLARVVEAHRHGESDARAVSLGLQRSGRIITSAALLMVIVMLGFAAAKMIVVKQVGVGLALSIILDATLVRMILVPATMTVMGRWNWWAPAPLRRLHERYGLEH